MKEDGQKKETEAGYSTDKGFIKWMVSRGGILFLFLPRGLGWLLQSAANVLNYGLEGVIGAGITLLIFYCLYLVVRWKESQIKKNLPAAGTKAKLVLFVLVIGVLFLLSS